MRIFQGLLIAKNRARRNTYSIQEFYPMGGRLLRRVSARTVRYTVIVLLLAAGLRSLIKGLAA